MKCLPTIFLFFMRKFSVFYYKKKWYHQKSKTWGVSGKIWQTSGRHWADLKTTLAVWNVTRMHASLYLKKISYGLNVIVPVMNPRMNLARIGFTSLVKVHFVMMHEGTFCNDAWYGIPLYKFKVCLFVYLSVCDRGIYSYQKLIFFPTK